MKFAPLQIPLNRKTSCRPAEHSPSQYIHKEGHSEPLKSRLEPPNGRICSALITGLMFPNDQCWSKSTDLPQKSSNVPHYKKEKSKHFIISQTSRSSTNSPKLFLQVFLASKYWTHLPHNPLFEHTQILIAPSSELSPKAYSVKNRGILLDQFK